VDFQRKTAQLANSLNLDYDCQLKPTLYGILINEMIVAILIGNQYPQTGEMEHIFISLFR